MRRRTRYADEEDHAEQLPHVSSVADMEQSEVEQARRADEENTYCSGQYSRAHSYRSEQFTVSESVSHVDPEEYADSPEVVDAEIVQSYNCLFPLPSIYGSEEEPILDSATASAFTW